MSEKDEQMCVFRLFLCCGLVWIRYLVSNLCCTNQRRILEKVGSVKSES